MSKVVELEGEDGIHKNNKWSVFGVVYVLYLLLVLPVIPKGWV